MLSQHNLDTTKVKQRMETNTAGLTSPFKQAFLERGLGGKIQKAYIGGERKAVGDIKKLTEKGVRQKYGQIGEKLKEQKTGIYGDIQRYRDEYAEAADKLKRWADNRAKSIFDLKTGVQDYLRNLVGEARKSLRGYVDDEEARNRKSKLEGFINMIGGGIEVGSAIGKYKSSQQDYSPTLRQQLGSSREMAYGQPIAEKFGGETEFWAKLGEQGTGEQGTGEQNWFTNWMKSRGGY